MDIFSMQRVCFILVLKIIKSLYFVTRKLNWIISTCKLEASHLGRPAHLSPKLTHESHRCRTSRLIVPVQRRSRLVISTGIFGLFYHVCISHYYCNSSTRLWSTAETARYWRIEQLPMTPNQRRPIQRRCQVCDEAWHPTTKSSPLRLSQASCGARRSAHPTAAHTS